MKDLLDSILHAVYCLDLIDIAVLLIIFSLIFIFISSLLIRKPWWRALTALMLGLCIGVIAYVTLFDRSGVHYDPSLKLFHSYCEMMLTGNREIFRSNFMNVLLFFPAGLLASSLLSAKLRPWLCVILVFVVFALFSGAIEYLQYLYALGRPEVDDTMHNALGALLGAMVGCIRIHQEKLKKLFLMIKDLMRRGELN